jgi:hypothetical protein
LVQQQRSAIELKVQVRNAIGPPDATGWNALMRIVISLNGDSELPAVVAALAAAGRSTGHLNSR